MIILTAKLFYLCRADSFMNPENDDEDDDDNS
jgi:hypothetical protein